MRNALINLISFYTINIASLSAQVLPVTMHPQQTNKWCWAASMQMVFDYHNTTVAQWDLATEYLSINYAKIIPNQPVTNSPYNVADCMCHQNSCETSCTTSNRPFKLCYAALPVYIDDNVPNPTVQWFDLLFSNRSYNSVQEVNPGLSANTMSWSDIADQIDSCRPFILVITKSGEQTQITSHAVVGKGYFESFSVEDNQMLQFVVINDPWDVCEGCERMIPYSSFLRDLNDSQVNCVLAYTYNIFPKTDQTCSSCDSEEPFANSLLVNTVKEIRDSLGNFIGTLKSTYTDEEYQAFINQDFIYSRIKKKFISLNNVLDTKNNNPPFDSLEHVVEVNEVVYKQSNPAITTTLEKLTNGNWIVKSISLCDVPEDVSEFLSDEIVSTYPLHYQFYRRQINNEYIWSPISTYPDYFGPSQPAIVGNFYKEKDILKALKTITVNTYGIPKKDCFINLGKIFGKKKIKPIKLG